MKYKPTTASNSTGLSGCQALLIFGAFFAVGLVGAYFLTYLPLARAVEARSWQEVPCVILTSNVKSSHRRNDWTYGVQMTYSFEFGGREYVGRRYNLEMGTSSNEDSKAAIVAEYPPGTETTCYVDPEDPFQSVVDRSPGLYLLWGLIPLPFVFGGLVGMLGFRFFSGGKPAGRRFS